MIERELAIHALDDAPRDRQAKAGALELARGGPVALFKILEDGGAALLGHAGARVGDGETHGAAGGHADAHANAAGFGELDRVARQIEQHLPQPGGVADEPARHVGRDGGGDFQPLALRARRQQLDHALDEPRQVERLVGELQLARLDAGEIENFVDQRGKRRARGLDGLDVGFLLAIERGFRQQAGHAENAVERRADFMADGGEEARLGLARRLGAVAAGGGFLQFPDFVAQRLGLIGEALLAPAPFAALAIEQGDGQQHDPAGQRGAPQQATVASDCHQIDHALSPLLNHMMRPAG